MKPYSRPMCACADGDCPEYRRLVDAYDTKQRLEQAYDKAAVRWLGTLDAYNAHLRAISRRAA